MTKAHDLEGRDTGGLTTHALDRPIWTALTTRHAGLAEGGDLARRYPADISPFAAMPNDGEENLEALAALARPDTPMLFLQADPVILPPALKPVTTADGVQMVATSPFPLVDDPRIVRLGWDDAADMLELAELTKPGPFTLKAQSLGAFWGIREDGRLIAMAGERLKVPGLTELSGLCTHPDRQGKGLGKLMLTYVAGQISARGEGVFLHSYAWNENAIRLYERLGFYRRSPMHVAFVEKT
ncbi:putative acetyltransferase [Hartmannibacter diazotrophicus]|uniref:Putative acetyltransferase n=1 Tax=Hartmannibacter diazotrophicus TaxID=1482074 RepID=A0A2C9DAF0_9HYPH|nr:GNAT family N-acetyltransferase [Hartmannibacter diazotrophicus]SON57302.1 putative acetyltransferase [Hartmannibacter diazotrophicus]